MRLSDFVIYCFCNCEESEGKETKKYDFGTIFLILKYLKLFEIKKQILVTTETATFDKLSTLSELRYFFVKILTNYKTDLRHTATMLLHHGCWLACIYSCIKFYCPKVAES